MREYLFRQKVEREQSVEVSEKIKAYKFEMRRISGNLEMRGSSKWMAGTADRNSTQNQLIFSPHNSDEETNETADNADKAILRTLYRRNRFSSMMSENRYM